MQQFFSSILSTKNVENSYGKQALGLRRGQKTVGNLNAWLRTEAMRFNRWRYDF